MTSKNLARRLERLENRLMPAKEEPIVILVEAVSSDGQIVGRFRLTHTGLQRLHSPAEAARSEAL